MKNTIASALIALVLLSCGSGKKTSPTVETVSTTISPTVYAQTITQEELKDKLVVYASDEFEGRDTGTPGQKKAVEFLKTHYQEIGAKSPLGDNDYFQEIPFDKYSAPDMTLTFKGRPLKNTRDFVSVIPGDDGEFSADEILDLGYGIDHENYSDYEGIDVSGKVIFVRSGEPINEDGIYLVSGTAEASKWSNPRQQRSAKRDAAKKNGAKAVLFYFPRAFRTYAKRYGGSSTRLKIKGSENPMYMLALNQTAIETFFGKDKGASNYDPNRRVIKGNFNFTFKNNYTDLVSENVIAYIPGSTKPNEYIVITSHLDHVGVEDGQIYNGADDDGSGTVAMMEIAEAFKQAEANGHMPKRSIVFLHVTAEEKGLLGSRYYTDVDPVFPLENTVANLNIDMIGRTDPKRTEGDRNYIYLIGSDKLSSDLHKVSERVNKEFTNIELDYTYNDDDDPNRFYYRSDHYNFAKNNIPIIFYFNGTHADYHKPTDTVDKIEFDLLENRTRLIFYTAWEVANRESRVKVDKAATAAN